MDTLSILLLEDARGSSHDIEAVLKERGWLTTRVRQPEEAAGMLRDYEFNLLLVHAESPRDWPLLLPPLLEAGNDVPALITTRAPIVSEAVAALRAGAADYLEWPAPLERLVASVEKATATGMEEHAGRNGSAKKSFFANIIGRSEKITRVFSLIERICDTDSTVLVYGESGTGKELISRALHYNGARRNGPFVPVNCGAIPGELLESELFGHEKGAFTHAIRTRMGRFEMAHGGTVFLDEISEMSPMLQVKLLRVLQERQFERIGGTKTIRSDFRVIAATNRNLEEEVKKGTFREDLFYRLNVIPIEAPSLRERTADIPLLVNHFIDKFNNSKRKAVTGIAPETLAQLEHYHWPGNVRELENVIERMVILSAGDLLTSEDLPDRLRQAGSPIRAEVDDIPGEGFVLSEIVADFERRLIVQALRQTRGVKNQAAKLLNVNRTTLIEKMKRYELTYP